jgi:hypothetical protein
MLTKNSKNTEIKEAFDLSNGQTRIFAKEVTKNPKFTTIFACQEVKGGGATAAQELLMGWGNRIVRAIHNADSVIAAKFKIGDVLPLDILSEEKTVPAYDGQSPKVNPSTGEIITYQGLPVYEHGSLVGIGEGKVVKLPKEEVTQPTLVA